MITVNVRHRENQCWGGLNIFHWFLSWRLSLVRTFQGGEARQFIKLLTSLGSCYIAACKTLCKFIFSWHRTNTSIDMSIYPRLLFLSFIIFKTQLSTSRNISMIWIVWKVSTHSHAERRLHDMAADNSYLDIWRVIQLNTPPPLHWQRRASKPTNSGFFFFICDPACQVPGYFCVVLHPMHYYLV